MGQLTRRSLIAGAAVAPVVAAASTARPGDPSSWDGALSNYVHARRRHEHFLVNTLDPEVRLARAAGLGLTVQIAALEELGDDLYVARHEALQALITVPAQDLEALRLKLRLAYDEVLQFEDGEGCIGKILADLDRLAG